MISPHLVPERYVAALATGGGCADIIALLRAGQLSKRLLQLRVIAASAADLSPAWAPAWRLLTQVQRKNPDAVGQTLLQPAVGGWAARCLRELLQPHPSSRGSTDPLGLGHFSAVAAVAATAAGVDFQIRVPARYGMVMLPGLGAAHFVNARDPSSTCAWVRGTPTDVTVHLSGERVLIPADRHSQSTSWRGLHRFRCWAGGLGIDLLLDDTDPYRTQPDPPCPEQVTPEQARAWHKVLNRAWALLVAQHREQAEGMAAGLVTLVPLQRAVDDRAQSATLVDAFGSVALTQPRDELDLALTLVHEFQHSKLAALHDLVALYDQTTHSPEYYAPWRDDPRPLGALFHGAYAHLGVAAFWRRHRPIARGQQAAVAECELAYWRRTLPLVLHQLRASGRLTDVGRRFVAGMTATIEEWLTEPLPAAAEDRAEDLVLNHWATWRLRHLRPNPAVVNRLAHRWLTGRPVVLDGAPAQERYCDAAWVGLVLSLRLRRLEALPSECADLASDRPAQLLPCLELVRAVYLRVRELAGTAPDELALIRWLVAGQSRPPANAASSTPRTGSHAASPVRKCV